MNRLILSLAIALALPTTPLLAAPAMAEKAEQAERGIAVGEQIPEFAATNQDGTPVNFDAISGQNGVVLAFFRSADWCPFCKRQLRDLTEISGELEAKGYPLVAISYDKVKKLKSFHDKHELGYTLLSDTESKMIDAFNVRHEGQRGRFDGIPHPTIFVISKDGSVKAKLYEESYRKRPQPEVILSTLEGLG